MEQREIKIIEITKLKLQGKTSCKYCQYLHVYGKLGETMGSWKCLKHNHTYQRVKVGEALDNPPEMGEICMDYIELDDTCGLKRHLKYYVDNACTFARDCFSPEVQKEYGTIYLDFMRRVS